MLEKFLDDAKEGAIYFSLGTNVESTILDDKQRNVILETLNELPYKVLRKCDDETSPSASDKTLTAPWFPQQDILRKFQFLTSATV